MKTKHTESRNKREGSYSKRRDNKRRKGIYQFGKGVDDFAQKVLDGMNK